MASGVLGLEMSHAPTASALISTFVRDITHSQLILRHEFIGQRWPSSVIAGCRTALSARDSGRRERTGNPAVFSSLSPLAVPLLYQAPKQQA
jgi:hypothetical protein